MAHGLKALVILACMASVSPSSAAQLDVDGNGILRGAFDVQVGIGLYSVEFVELSCFEVYPPCDGSTVFPFPSPFFAQAASEALLEQVFLDGPQGLFDSNPLLTYGCPGLGGDDDVQYGCSVYTFYGATDYPPFLPTGLAYAFQAGNGPGDTDGVGPHQGYGMFDFGGQLVAPFRTMAVWSGPPWQASEPGTFALLSLGLLGLGLTRRRA